MEAQTKYIKRGDTKMRSYRLPVDTIHKIEDMAKQRNQSKVQVIVEAIDQAK